jgi:hypothetical protein
MTTIAGLPAHILLVHAVVVVVAVGSVVTVYRIGDSGARASWTGQFSQQATTRVPAQGG